MAELVKPEAKGKEVTSKKGEKSGGKVSKTMVANFCACSNRKYKRSRKRRNSKMPSPRSFLKKKKRRRSLESGLQLLRRQWCCLFTKFPNATVWLRLGATSLTCSSSSLRSSYAQLRWLRSLSSRFTSFKTRLGWLSSMARRRLMLWQPWALSLPFRWLSLLLQ